MALMNILQHGSEIFGGSTMAEIYKDKRGWLYTIRETLKSGEYSAFYRKPEQNSWYRVKNSIISTDQEEVDFDLLTHLGLRNTGVVGWYNGENSSINPVLTEEGLLRVNAYICELMAKQVELLAAKKDTADDIEIATVADILSDMDEHTIQDVGDGLEYINGWPVTDNYEADYVLRLEYEKDFVWLK